MDINILVMFIVGVGNNYKNLNILIIGFIVNMLLGGFLYLNFLLLFKDLG